MKKKINGLSNLVNQFINDDTISFHDFLNLFDCLIDTQFMGFQFESVTDRLLMKRSDGTMYKNEPLCIITLKLKKKDRIKIQQILSKNKSDNQLTFFYHYEYDENQIQLSREIMFRNDKMYRLKNFTLYHFLYQMRKLLPHLLIDLEMMLYGSL